MTRRPGRVFDEAANSTNATHKNNTKSASITVKSKGMDLSLVSLCARAVVSNHSLFSAWLGCLPWEVYRPLLDAAFEYCRPLVVGELVQRWPERILTVGGQRKVGQWPPNRFCVQALLLAVVRGLCDKRCRLQLLDLCGLQDEDSRLEDPRGNWSFTVVLCSMLQQARAVASMGHHKDAVVVVRIRADLFINARSWERVRGTLKAPGPLRLYCRYLRVEELPAPSIAALLDLFPREGLLGLDIRYSSLGVSGLALLLPLLAPFPALCSLRLHYCNLDLQCTQSGQQGALQEMAQGLSSLTNLRRFRLIVHGLSGQSLYFSL